MLHLPYSSAFVRIVYVMVHIRSDVSHAVSVVGPGKVHWPVVKWILHYLWGVTNVGLVFDKGSGIRFNVIGYVDSDYACDLVVTREDNALEQIVFEENPVDMLTKLVLVFKYKELLGLNCCLYLVIALRGVGGDAMRRFTLRT
jgi:hypothetical protein